MDSNFSYSGAESNFLSIDQAKAVQAYIDSNDLQSAWNILHPNNYNLKRNSLWHYMSGNYYYKKGWLESAYEAYKTAYEMQPHNETFAGVYIQISDLRKGNKGAFKKSEPKSCCCCNIMDDCACFDSCTCCSC